MDCQEDGLGPQWPLDPALSASAIQFHGVACFAFPDLFHCSELARPFRGWILAWARSKATYLALMRPARRTRTVLHDHFRRSNHRQAEEGNEEEPTKKQFAAFRFNGSPAVT
jgi:hypothetical protein